jgi:hypothetical protein
MIILSRWSIEIGLCLHNCHGHEVRFMFSLKLWKSLWLKDYSNIVWLYICLLLVHNILWITIMLMITSYVMEIAKWNTHLLLNDCICFLLSFCSTFHRAMNISYFCMSTSHVIFILVVKRFKARCYPKFLWTRCGNTNNNSWWLRHCKKCYD